MNRGTSSAVTEISGTGTGVETSVLDNAVWHSLRGAHREFALATGAAARYDPEVSVFAALRDDADDAAEDAWRDLATLVGDAGTGALFRAAPVVVPAGWTRVGGGIGHQMVLHELQESGAPDASWRAARPLGADDVGEMLALVELTRPGPFDVRTVELGGYVGVFDGSSLVAMAGERLAPPGFREISAVCTHPDFRGRGLASELTARVARAILARGEQPFLHHAAENPARTVYEALGFEFRCEVSWTVVTRG